METIAVVEVLCGCSLLSFGVSSVRMIPLSLLGQLEANHLAASLSS